MRVQIIRLCVGAVLLAGISFTVVAQGTLMLQVAVSGGTCDMRIVSEREVHFSPFAPENFKHSVFLPDTESPIVLSLPGGSCSGTPLSLNRRLWLTVTGPEALGGRGAVWGNRNEDLAWGVRLRYRTGGRGAFLPLAPDRNQLVVSRTERQGTHHDAGHEIVMQPELYSWANHLVKPQQNVMIPLVFSVVYE